MEKFHIEEEKFIQTTALKKILAMKARKKVIAGGSSSGKSIAILSILISRCAKIPNYEVCVVRDTVPHLKDGIMRDFIAVMKLTKRWNKNHWNITERLYTFANGSTIKFANADEDKAVGPRYHCIYFNEAVQIPYEVYNQMEMRCKGDVFIDFNPARATWPTQKVLLDTNNSEFIRLTYEDNEAIPPTSLASLMEK